jgi:hypothetical protein
MKADDVRWRKRAARALVALAALPAAAAPAAAAELRGFVSDGPAGLLAFQRCEGAALAKALERLSDKTPDTALTAAVAAVRRVMEDPDRPLYVEFSADAAGGVLAVRRFYRAIGHVGGCAEAPKDIAAGVRLHAAGANPGWKLVAGAGGARLELAPGKAVRFPAGPFAAPAAGRSQVFDAWSAVDGGTIRVEIAEEVCLDEQAETATGARVALRYATSAYEGCAARF